VGWLGSRKGEGKVGKGKAGAYVEEQDDLPEHGGFDSSDDGKKKFRPYPAGVEWQPSMLPFALSGEESFQEILDMAIEAYEQSARYAPVGGRGTATNLHGVKLDFSRNLGSETGLDTGIGGATTFAGSASASDQKDNDEENLDGAATEIGTDIPPEGAQTLFEGAKTAQIPATSTGRQTFGGTLTGTDGGGVTTYAFDTDTGMRTISAAKTDVNGARTAVLQYIDESKPMLGEREGTYLYDEYGRRRRLEDLRRFKPPNMKFVAERLLNERCHVTCEDREIHGTLLGFDSDMNTVLRDAKIFQWSEKFGWIVTRSMEEAHISGHAVKSLSFPDVESMKDIAIRRPRMVSESLEETSPEPEFDNRGRQINKAYRNETQWLREVLEG